MQILHEFDNFLITFCWHTIYRAATRVMKKGKIISQVMDLLVSECMVGARTISIRCTERVSFSYVYVLACVCTFAHTYKFFRERLVSYIYMGLARTIAIQQSRFLA